MLVFKTYRDKKKIRVMKDSGIANFEEGNMDCLNPKISINDQADLLPYDRRFEFPKEKLIFKERLGMGAFGIVTKAIACNILPLEDKTVVAVKSLEKTADKIIVKSLITELKVMIHLGQHLNIVNLLGAVTRNIARKDLMMIFEYCPHGNLQNVLQNYELKNGTIETNLIQSNAQTNPTTGYLKLPEINFDNPQVINLEVICNNTNLVINSSNLISWCFQISRGMDYLASRNILHGDLASRNILLCEDNIVKICDFGLSKNLYKNYLYKRNPETPVPYKWLSLEAFEKNLFSVYSDIWAFGKTKQSEILVNYCIKTFLGVLIWEVFSLGKTPYPDINDAAILLEKLQSGMRLNQPVLAPEGVFLTMMDCWKKNRKERPVITATIKYSSS
jgi:FMS-like tyrosine kinase 1